MVEFIIASLYTYNLQQRRDRYGKAALLWRVSVKPTRHHGRAFGLGSVNILSPLPGVQYYEVNLSSMLHDF